MVNKLKKTWYAFTWGEQNIAADNLVVEGSDLLSIVSGKVAKSAATNVIAWVAVGSKTYWVNETIDFLRKNDNLRVDLATVTDLAQANVGNKFNINASQAVVLTAAWTQVELVEIVDTRVGRFKLV